LEVEHLGKQGGILHFIHPKFKLYFILPPIVTSIIKSKRQLSPVYHKGQQFCLRMKIIIINVYIVAPLEAPLGQYGFNNDTAE